MSAFYLPFALPCSGHGPLTLGRDRNHGGFATHKPETKVIKFET